MSWKSLAASLMLMLALGSCGLAEKPKRVLLLGQTRDHPAGTHEYMSGLHVLGKCLQGVPGLEAKILNADGDWPEGPGLIREADGIVLYLGEGGRWMLADAKRREAIAALAARGGAIVGIHWAIGARDAKYIPGHLKWMGGMHGGPDRKYTFSTADLTLVAPKHPITRGVEPLRLKDEFYYQLKFAKQGKVTPLVAASIDGKAETCAWAFERPDGGRSFGFCAMHDHVNWGLVPCRRLIAQGVLSLVFGRSSDLVKQGVGVMYTLYDRGYSRDQEYQADSYGVQIMAAAGYNPEGAVTALAKLGLDRSKGINRYLATHPDTPDRIDRIARLGGISPQREQELIQEARRNPSG